MSQFSMTSINEVMERGRKQIRLQQLGILRSALMEKHPGELLLIEQILAEKQLAAKVLREIQYLISLQEGNELSDYMENRIKHALSVIE